VNAPSAAVPTTGVRSLRQLLPDTIAVVDGRAVHSESYDEDRLRVHRVHVEHVLQGRLDPTELGVVDMRGASQRPPLLAEERAVILLAPAPPLSYLREQLGPDRFFVPAGGRDGIIATPTDPELAAVVQAIADGVAIASLEGPEAITARRRLAFSELAGPSPRLAADGLVELRQLGPLSPLAEDELATFARVFRNVQITVPTRAGLATLLAERGAREALPGLLAAETDTPAMLDALLAARARLGSPATTTELTALLASSDVGVRAAALHALASMPDADATTAVEKAATSDPDASVRGAAIDALGTPGRAQALPVLSGTFASKERDLQQRSARAIITVGGPAADDALVTLALHGDRPETRSYAAVLLLATRGANSAAVQRLVASKPGPEVMHVIEHGLEMGHHHAAP
jgi:HEAT repeat protein